MKRFQFKRRSVGLLTLVALGLAMAGCKSDDRSMAQKWGDRQVARNVKKELNQDPMYHYADVVPLVRDGTVQLTGFVDTTEQRQRAAQLAAQAKGALEIINTIELKPMPTGRAGSRLESTNAPAEPAEPQTAPESPVPAPEPKANP